VGIVLRDIQDIVENQDTLDIPVREFRDILDIQETLLLVIAVIAVIAGTVLRVIVDIQENLDIVVILVKSAHKELLATQDTQVLMQLEYQVIAAFQAFLGHQAFLVQEYLDILVFQV
jgi:hypothetical protein